MANTIDLNQLAKFWDISVSTLRNFYRLEKDPLPKESPGKFDFVKACKWMYEYQKRIIEKQSPFTFTREQTAEILQVDKIYLNDLVKREELPIEKFNTYDIRKVFIWNKKRYEKRIDDCSKDRPQDLLAARSAELKQLQIQEKKGELLDKFEVSAAWINQLQIIKGTIQGLAVKLSTKLPCDPKLTIEVAEKEIAVLLNKIANTKLELEDMEE
jgi:hypothetical protein